MDFRVARASDGMPAVKAEAAGRARRLLERLRGNRAPGDVTTYSDVLDEINDREPGLRNLRDAELLARSRELAREPSEQALTAAAFALVREAARRVLGQRPYDVQMLAGLAMADGKLAEMKTGEGKTLAAVAPAYLAALRGRGVHLLTFNDYLAGRDAAWMGPVYELLGFEVRFVQGDTCIAERRRAYAADVTYVTAREIGFDYLRDSLCRDRRERVQRPFQHGIVDEADSILIDEARIPLVLAGDFGNKSGAVGRVATIVGELEPGAHFVIEDDRRNVNLTDSGLDVVENRLGVGNLTAPENLVAFTEINCALHVRALMRRDVDYIVRGGQIELVDQLTGRVVEDRQLPDGLQAAVEAREGLGGGAGGTILGSITLQNLRGLYPRLSGMTATALPAAEELGQLYDLDIVPIPVHRSSVREDCPDRIFTDRAARDAALVEEIRSVHAAGRPILVGTASVEDSEKLAAALAAAGIDVRVLNARRDEFEAAIVAEAGAVGAVTISTNMAGRGTDIRLGGADERERDRVAALGGLYVIGTNRHESRRIDDQLRGRAGRQGDPGSTRFFISLEDPLIEGYGVAELIRARFGPLDQESELDDPFVRREIRRAQRIIENEHLEIRRTLARYSAFVELQRLTLHDRRQRVLEGQEKRFLEQATPTRYASLRERYGAEVVESVGRQLTLFHIDLIWREHMVHVSDLRESVHLVRVGGRDPLTAFQLEIAEAFQRRLSELDQAIVESFERALVGPSGLDLACDEFTAPSSTWTYMINDDPFRDHLSTKLAGDIGMGIGLVVNFPIFLAWLLYRRLRRPPGGR